MTDRLHIDGPTARIVLSKSGYDADNPALADANKLFDSEWLFSGTLIEAGIYTDTASYSDGTPVGTDPPDAFIRTSDSFSHVINFTALSFVPSVTLLPLVNPIFWPSNGGLMFAADFETDRYHTFGGSNKGRSGDITVTSSSITIPRLWQFLSGDGSYNYFREDYLYLVTSA